MNIRPLRQPFRIDLCHRAEHHELPVRTRRGDGIDQRGIETLVNHAKESEPRTRDLFLIFRIFAAAARLHEVFAIDAARKSMYKWMFVTLGLVQTVAAGENNVGSVQEFKLLEPQAV